MAIRYLLDTNTISYAIRGDPAQVRVRLKAVRKSAVGISVFSQAELLYGLARKPLSTRLRQAVEGFLWNFEVLLWDSAAAISYGDLRAGRERKGRPLSHEDLMIAAHALSLGLTLVTHDHVFALIEGLKTEDWTAT